MAADTLKRTLLSALGWSVVIKAAFQALSWALTLVVIHVLAPGDYGLIAISQVFTAFMLGFADLGLGDALLQRPQTSRAQVESVFGTLIVISVALAAALSLAAYPIARYYADPRLVPLIQVSSLGFVFNALTALPRMFLQKQLRLRPVFVAELSSGLLGSLVVIALAFGGYGVWALALGGVAGALARQAAFILVAREFYVRPRFDFAEVRPLLGFGAYTTLEYTAFMIMVTADVLIVGRLLGPADLGVYTVVLNFAALPLNKVAPIVNAISFPAFAMLQHDRGLARAYVLKGLRIMALLVVPVFLGIGVTAPEIVAVVFGPAWSAAGPLLPILSGALVFRAMLILLPKYLQGTGDAPAAFWCTATGAIACPAAILVGCHWGLPGACWAWLAAYPAVFLVEAAITARRAAFTFASIALTPLRPLVAGLVMVLAVLATRAALPVSPLDGAAPVSAPVSPQVWRLLALAAVGAAVYPAAIRLLFPSTWRELHALLRPNAAPRP